MRGQSLGVIVLGALAADGACESTAIRISVPEDAGLEANRRDATPEPDAIPAPDTAEDSAGIAVPEAPRASVIQLAVGGDHSCALLSTGQVKCWGWNESGEIGDGTTVDRFLPTLVVDVADATAIAAGNHFSCALLADQTVKCWGDNYDGQVGMGARTVDWPYRVPSPAKVIGLGGVAQLAAGAAHACVVLDDATVRCWGNNHDGELGDGTTIDEAVPVPVPGFAGALAIAPGGFQTYARMNDGIVMWSGSYALGDLALAFDSLSPVVAQTLPGMVELSAGYFHACAVLSNGAVKCWGENSCGSLGDGTTNSSLVPVDVVGLGNIVSVAAASDQTCALAADGTVACWGCIAFGEVGDGTDTAHLSPVWIPGLTGVVEISAGGWDVCARLDDGSVRCWGENIHGQIGDGTTDPRNTPTLVEGLP